MRLLHRRTPGEVRVIELTSELSQLMDAGRARWKRGEWTRQQLEAVADEAAAITGHAGPDITYEQAVARLEGACAVLRKHLGVAVHGGH